MQPNNAVGQMTDSDIRSVTALLRLYTQIEHVSSFFRVTKDRSFAIRGMQSRMKEQVADILPLFGEIDTPLASLWRSVSSLLQRVPVGEARLSREQVLGIYLLASHTWYSRALGDSSDAEGQRQQQYVTVHPPGMLIELFSLGSKNEANPEELIGTLLRKCPWWKFWK